MGVPQSTMDPNLKRLDFWQMASRRRDQAHICFSVLLALRRQNMHLLVQR